MKATLSNYRQSPRKVRLVADAIRGKSVPAARRSLRFLDKRAAPAVLKLLESAVANARRSGASADELLVRSITVDKGRVQKRFRPFARGRAGTIRKTASHVVIELAQAGAAKPRRTRSSKLEARS